MPAALISRDEDLQRLAVAFRQDGYDVASISRLSASTGQDRTGLGKASLYHYFPDCQTEMAAAVLEHLGNSSMN